MGQPTSQMRTIAYNDEAVLWNMSNHLMGIRLLSQVTTVMVTSSEPELR
jgi:hypothetical protein